MYEVVWNGDEAGIWKNDKQVVAVWELARRRLTPHQVCQWSQRSIAWLVAAVEKSRRPSHNLAA